MNANIWDTWGITPTDFNLEFFRKTVRGQVPAGYSIRDWQQGAEQPSQHDSDLSIVSAREKEMHSVLFVLTPEGCKRSETIATVSNAGVYVISRKYDVYRYPRLMSTRKIWEYHRCSSLHMPTCWTKQTWRALSYW